MSLFVETSAWYAAADKSDFNNHRAKEVLSSGEPLITTDHVLIETWLLLHHKIHRQAANLFWERLRSGVAKIELVSPEDLEVAWAIGEAFPDQDFSIVDRTSFAAMQRLGISRVASFDSDFAVFRFGAGLRKAFEVIR